MVKIKELRENAGLSQETLAKICGVHQTAVSQWENGRTSPDRQCLLKLSEYFCISADELLGNDKRPIVPILGKVRAGIPIEAEENILGYEDISRHMASQGEHFALIVQGDSMQPRICPGDVVIVRKQDDVDSGDIAVVLIGGEAATIKKVVKKDNMITLTPLNLEYEPLMFSADEIVNLPVSIIGRVVELRGKM